MREPNGESNRMSLTRGDAEGGAMMDGYGDPFQAVRGKPAIKSAGMLSGSNDVLLAIAGAVVTYQTTGKLDPGQLSFFTAIILNGILGLWGRYKANSKITSIF